MIEEAAAKIWHSLLNFSTKTLYSAFLKYFVENRDTLWILIGIVIILAIILKIPRVKLHPFLPKVINNACGVLIILVCIVGFLRFVLPWWNSLEKNSSSSSTAQNSTTPTQKTIKTTQKTTTPQTQKQLWYTVSCTNCWAEDCSHSGYYYNGLNVDYYNYYANICRNCSCNDFKAQSYWR